MSVPAGGLPLRILLPVAVLTFGLALLVLLASLELWSAFRRAESEGMERARLLGAVVAAGVENAYRRNSPGDAADAFARLSADRSLGLGLLLDEHANVALSTRLVLRGRPLAETPLAAARGLLTSARTSLLGQVMVTPSGGAVIGAFPVRLAPLPGEPVPSRVGVLLTRHPLGPSKRAAVAGTLMRAAVIAPLLVVFCAAAWWSLHVGLLRRIRALMRATERVAAGERGVRANVSGAGEIHSLAAAFDRMAETLDRRHAIIEQSRAFQAALLDAVPANMAVLDADGRIVAVNRNWREFGARNGLALPDSGIGASYVEVCDHSRGRFTQGAAEVAGAIRALFAGTLDDFRLEYPCPSPDTDRWFSIHLTRFEANDARQVLATHIDITAVKRTEQALAVEEARYRTVYDQNPSMFFTVDADGTIVSVNDFGAAQLGYSVSDLMGTSIEALYEPDDWPDVAARLGAFSQGVDGVRRWQARKRRRDGSLFWARESARTLAGSSGTTNVLVVCEDITELQEVSARLRYQASHDALTGLMNRYEFDRRLQHAVEDAACEGSEHVLCYIDLDQFKVVNDTCGHMAGDELLRQVAARIRARLRQGDALARLGGDEFGLLMQHCPLERGCRIADQVRAAVEQTTFHWNGRAFGVGCSIGVTSIDADTLGATNALSAADAACYSAKDEGRNRVHAYRPDDIELTRRHGEMEWVSRIQEALVADSFELHCQLIEPAVPTPNDTALRYELLLRMRSGEGERIPPGRFLPAAERYSLAPKLDRWVLERAMALLGAQPQHLANLRHCGINLSGQSLSDEGFLEFALERVRGSGVRPDCICFEITETAVISNLARATRFIETLSALGCVFALDDFGSGLSSFAYLKQLPVHFVKIDGVFVKDMETDPLDAAMVRSINQIAQLMGKQTIAEFVETEAIARSLRELGVDYLQGYAVDRPRPIAQLLESRGRASRRVS